MQKCVCGKPCVKYGLCQECNMLLRAKRSKNIAIVEKFRNDYNNSHTYKTYGQFVALLDLIYRRKKSFDNRRKKGVSEKIRGNRR